MDTRQPIAYLSEISLGRADTTDDSTFAANSPKAEAGVVADSHTSQYMGFRIGPLGLLLPVNDGREVIAPPPVSRLPHTASWLRGLANVRGTLVPVVDGAAALGIAREPGTPTYLLIFGEGETASGLLIDGLPRLLDIASFQRRSDLSDIPGPLVESVAAAYEHDGVTWLAVDLRILFDALARQIVPVMHHGNSGSGLN